MTTMKLRLFIACGMGLLASTLCAQDSKDRIKVTDGPATASLGNVARIEIPSGFQFIDGKTMQRVMKASGQPVSDNLMGSMSPTNADWSVWFSYDDIGYVKDTDKDALNADKLLQDYKEGTEAANKVREKSGHPPIHVVGWEQPPRYNETTHNLEWAIRGTCEGEEILNYDTRLLGRKGVMQVKLIVEPKEFSRTMPEFTNLLAGYSFQTGQSYAEYKPGDKVAKYGLAALVVGGAAVGAAKLGLFAWAAVLLKKFWKVIVIAVVAVASVFRKVFSAIFRRRDETISRQ
jgi:uncharacterized membrane-anchored protein